VTKHVLITEKSEEILSSALWALSFIADSEGTQLDDKLLIGLVIQYIESNNTDFKIPAIRTIGSICAGDIEAVNKVIEAGALTSLATSLQLEKEYSILVELCWAISNISLGPPEHIDKLIKAKIIHRLIEIIFSYNDFRVV